MIAGGILLFIIAIELCFRIVSSFCGIFRCLSFLFYYCKILVYEPRYSTGSEMCQLILTQFCSSKKRNVVNWLVLFEYKLIKIKSQNQPPTLIVWGRHDGYMPDGAARAYLRDPPDAELHLVEGGHWALETNLQDCYIDMGLLWWWFLHNH
jgi:hypothetical protein